MASLSAQLKRAAFDGDLSAVRELLDAGADPNATDEHGSGTLLTFHSDVVQYLLSRGADANVQTNETGYCPISVIQLILDAGGDTTVRDVNGDSPLSWASWHLRDRRVIDLLNSDGKGNPLV